tara:strand:+ start:1514 stop:1891 length:378 start_codon:yes stop_codon:yes gene_type:complete
MMIEVSTAEVLDKLSILRIKLEFITQPEKIDNIRKEHNHISEQCQTILQNKDIAELYKQLLNTNKTLWRIEDGIRFKEKEKAFDENFIQLARKVYQTNDQRSEIKKRINTLTESNFTEEKSYTEY